MDAQEPKASAGGSRVGVVASADGVTPLAPPITRECVSLHEAVRAALPSGVRVESAFRYGMSLWGDICKIVATLEDGEREGEGEEYLLKVAETFAPMMNCSAAKTMIEGEYASLRALHDVLPVFVPRPIAKGVFVDGNGKNTYFLIEEFRHIGEQPPAPERFTELVATIHRESVSPTGKFGFHIETCSGTVPQGTGMWDESWTVVYREALRSMILQDNEANGPWPELDILCRITLDNVVPRLLEPLQSDGRSIKPCLVHGDLWDGNTATDLRTGEPFVFDPGSFYAHNEYEVGNWRAARHQLSKGSYVAEYLSKFPASEPKGEWGDRNVLYSLRFNLGASVMFPHSWRRVDGFEDMTFLCEKYFPGLFESELARLLPGPASSDKTLQSQVDVGATEHIKLPGSTVTSPSVGDWEYSDTVCGENEEAKIAVGHLQGHEVKGADKEEQAGQG